MVVVAELRRSALFGSLSSAGAQLFELAAERQCCATFRTAYNASPQRGRSKSKKKCKTVIRSATPQQPDKNNNKNCACKAVFILLVFFFTVSRCFCFRRRQQKWQSFRHGIAHTPRLLQIRSHSHARQYQRTFTYIQVYARVFQCVSFRFFFLFLLVTCKKQQKIIINTYNEND